MLMCEFVDEKNPVVQASAKEIVTLHEEKVFSQDHGSETRVDGTDIRGDSEAYADAMDVSAIFAGANEALIALSRP